MPITQADVLEVLRDPKLHTIRFSVGPIDVNSDEYDTVADYIEAGAITVVPGSQSYSLYFPQNDTLQTRNGDPPLDLNSRTNMLHECTHAISDMNGIKVTRMIDEAAAYLAQFTYLMLLDPSLEKPPLGPPLNNMMRQGMDLVNKYHLGEPAGFGAQIDQSDILSLAQAVHAIPEYRSIGENAILAANGIALSDDQAETFARLRLQRFMTQLGDEMIRRDVEQMLTTKVQYSAHENYVTADPELLTLFQSYARGGIPEKNTVKQKLTHIFLTIDQNSAGRLLQRLSTPIRGDMVSQQFQSVFSSSDKQLLISALKFQR